MFVLLQCQTTTNILKLKTYNIMKATLELTDRELLSLINGLDYLIEARKEQAQYLKNLPETKTNISDIEFLHKRIEREYEFRENLLDVLEDLTLKQAEDYSK